MNKSEAFIAIAIISLITAALRFAPFLFLNGKKLPPVIENTVKTLPYAVMAMLVVYCLKDVSFTSYASWVPYIAASAVTAGIHLLRRSSLLSIICGTACCMLLTQLL